VSEARAGLAAVLFTDFLSQSHGVERAGDARQISPAHP
jgi:hypothetical protein